MVTNGLSVREQILATASNLFLKQGYNLTGINQIIEEAGIAKASLYYHFSSKEELCVAYLQNRAIIWQNGLNEYLQPYTSPVDRIIHTFDYRLKYMEQTNFNGCSYIRIVSEIPQEDNKLHQQAVAIKEMHRSFFKDLSSKLQQLSPGEQNNLANTLLLLFDGGTIESHIYKSGNPLTEARRAVIDLLAFYNIT